MKFCLLLFIISVMNVSAFYSQDAKIDLSIENEPLIELFKEIENQTEYSVFYKNDQINDKQTISITGQDLSVKEALLKVLKNSDVEYIMKDQHIVLTKIEHAPKTSSIKEERIQRENINLQKARGLAFYQNRIIKGQVTTIDGESLPGVNILVEGTNVGTVTDVNGYYSIDVPEGAEILVFSYIGYLTEKTAIAGQSNINMQLIPDLKKLDEVVVVGYGVMKERDITGSISKVKGELIANQPNASLDAGLQGLATGVQVSQASGTPGGASRVMIRGTNSISSGTEPLYIIDGIPIWQDITGNIMQQAGSTFDTQNPLADINPNDIASIEVLKDASATAIYGSKGANGVIIISTKSGKEGKGQISANYQQGMTMPGNLLQYANTNEWFEMLDQSRYNIRAAGSYDPETGEPLPGTFVPLTNTDIPAEWSRLRAQYTDVNHLDHYLQNGALSEFNLNTSNGTEKTSYFVSLNYRKEEGIAKGNVFERFNIRSNIDFDAQDWVKIGARIGLSFIDNDRPITGNNAAKDVGGKNDKGAIGGFWTANSSSLPIFPVYNENGEYFAPLSGRNVVASLDRNNTKDNATQYRAISLFFTEIRPVKDVMIRGEAAIDYLNTDQVFWLSGNMRTIDGIPSPLGYDMNRVNRNTNYVLYANYSKNLENHSFSLTAGTEANRLYIRRRDIRAENAALKEIGEFQNEGNIGAMDDVFTLLSGVHEDKKYVALFSRANYKLMDKYLLNFSIRRDASSVFAKDRRWYTFSAVSGGWILSAEDFMSGIDQISFLKLRGSYGIAGNDKIPSGLDEDGYQVWPSYAGAGGLTLNNLANNELTWEKSYQLDIGLEYGFMQNRFSGSLSYYNQKATDMLLYTPIPLSVGIAMSSSSWINVGDMKNWGWEFDITSKIINKSDLKWSATLNFTTNNNEILKLTDAIAQNPLGINIKDITCTREGESLASFYLADYAGIDDEGYETIYEYDQDLIEEGIFKRTGNIIRASRTNIENNKIIHEGKTGLPTYYGGITNNLSYKGIELSFLFSGQGGNYIWDDAEADLTYIDDGQHNILKKVYGNTWTGENPDAAYPMLRYNNNQSPATDDGSGSIGKEMSRFLYKGDFLKLRNVTLGYNFPDDVCSRLRLSKLRIYLTGQNLLTFTGYEGYDPEFVKLSNTSQDRNLTQGYISKYNLPLIRTFLAGINITF